MGRVARSGADGGAARLGLSEAEADLLIRFVTEYRIDFKERKKSDGGA